MDRKTAWILTLGTEVARGLVVNTNAAFLGRRLSQLGLDVEGVLTLVDDKRLIADLLGYVLRTYSPSLVVTTGGLGPTYDDVTLEAVAEALGRPLVLNPEALQMIREKFVSRGYELTRERVKMAYMPEGAAAIPNPVGTAPGALIRHGSTTIVCLPGVPREMEEMWLRHVEGSIGGLAGASIAEGSILVSGVPESTLAPVLRSLSEAYSSSYIKSHPRGYELSSPLLEVYVSAVAPTEGEARALVREICGRIAGEAVRLGGAVREYRCPS